MRTMEELEEGLLARIPMNWLHGVFTPGALLDAGQANEYMELLNLLAEAPVDLMEADDVRVLLNAFDVGGYPRLIIR